MLHLMIENKGECPVEGFTVLGLSTARDDNDSIGQFGSGNKHGMLLCMRHNLNPIVYTGKDKLEFFSKPAKMGEKGYSQIYYTINNGSPEKLSMCLEFGELDWDNLAMALREFISNAIDASDINDVKVDITNKIESKQGYTRVYIPMTPEVQKFYNDISKWFLHFDDEVCANTYGVIEKSGLSIPRIYRKGVFVREVEHKESLYDYNFGEELKIDESRCLSDYAVLSSMSRKLSSTKDISKVFDAFEQGIKFWEEEAEYWNISPEEDVEEAWKELFNEKFPNHVISFHGVENLVGPALKKSGYDVLICSEGWYKSLRECGIPTFNDVLDHYDETGKEILPATKKAEETVEYVWNKLLKLGLTLDCKKPEVKCFKDIMREGAWTAGFYSKGVVYLNVNNTEDKKCALEEIAHHITKAPDSTRDFQDYAFNVAAELLKNSED